MKTTKTLIALTAALLLHTTAALAIVFTSDTTIAPGDTTYDGLEIIVSGCTVTVNGTHTFNRLVVTNGGILTHSPASSGQAENHLQLTIAQDLIVTAGSSIAADGKGYSSAAGPGAPTTVNAGGGHGGEGGKNGGPAYGSILQPVEWGSGGWGSAGGGAIRLVVNGVLQLDGVISAEGNASIGGGGGGSVYLTVGTLGGGGQISVNGGVGNGNAGLGQPGGGGGGGRVAILYTTDNFAGSVTAAGGSAWDIPGGAGTVYRQSSGESIGRLVVDNNAQVNGVRTPLTSPVAFHLVLTNDAKGYAQSPLTVTTLTVATNSSLVQLSGQTNLSVTVLNNAVVASGGVISADGAGYGSVTGPGAPPAGYDTEGGAYGGMGGKGGGHESGATYGSIMQPVDSGSGGVGSAGGGAVRLTVGGVLTLDGTLSANGTMSLGGGSGGSLYLTVGTLSGAGQIWANGGVGTGNASIGHPGGGGGGGRVAIYYATDDFTGSVTAAGGSAWDTPGGAGTVYRQSSDESIGRLVVDNNAQVNGARTPLTSPAAFHLVLNNGAKAYAQSPLTVTTLTVATNSSLVQLSGQTNLFVTVLNNAVVASGGVISADGAGYGSVTGPGAPSTGDNTEGGAYGGMGGRSGGRESGAAYGSVVQPVDRGSGGVGSAGGGALLLSVGGVLTLDGILTANGATSLGGGSGGSIYLTVGTLSGAGQLSANGGVGTGNASLGHPGGGGGGGRVAIYYATNNFAGSVTAVGGSAWDTPGGAGTIYWKRAVDVLGQVLVDNRGQTNVTRLSFALWPPTEPLILTVSNSAIVIPNTPLLLAALHLAAGAVMTHDAGFPDFNLTVLGDVTISSNSTINVNGKGYGARSGPGAPFATGDPPYEENSGASYGGLGGVNAGSPGPTYGSATAPVNLGSGADASSGGGAVRLSVGGSLALNGAISANGTIGGGGASGGSVYLTVGTLSGPGLISASGGDSIGNEAIAHIGAGGGGGRIAIYVQTMVGFSGTVHAPGGAGSPPYAGTPGAPGNPGTVYFATNNFPLLSVVGQTPSGTVKSVVNSVTVTFNTPANATTLTPADLVVQTPSGPIPQGQLGVVPLGGTLFQIMFPSQSALGAYSIQVGPNIAGLFGQGMDQNGNGTPGEGVSDAYSGSFAIAQPTLSGSVHATNGWPIGGLTVRAADGSATTQTGTNGTYALTLSPGWSGTVMPDSAGWTWTPYSRTYVNLTADATNQNFSGTLAESLVLTTTRSAANLLFGWPSAVGLHYQLQSATNLSAANWRNEGPPFVGTGGVLSTNVAVGPEPQQFFRLQLLNN